MYTLSSTILFSYAKIKTIHFYCLIYSAFECRLNELHHIAKFLQWFYIKDYLKDCYGSYGNLYDCKI